MFGGHVTTSSHQLFSHTAAHASRCSVGWVMGLTTEPQHKAVGQGARIEVDSSVQNKILILK